MEALLEQAHSQALHAAKMKAIYSGPKGCDLGRVQHNCPVHGVYFATGTASLTPSPHRNDWTPCPDCLAAWKVLDRQRQAELEQQHREREIEERIIRADIPMRFIGKTMADYKSATEAQCKVKAIAQDYVDRFAVHREKGSTLILAGTPGTGKSLLSMLIAQDICRKGIGVKYTTCSGMILAIRRTWGKEGEGRETDVLDGFKETNLLVLDEVGAQAGTENEKNLLFEVLDARYAEMRPTIIATNLNKPAFQEFVGDRIWDRLVEVGRWVPFAWESYRPQARREMAE